MEMPDLPFCGMTAPRLPLEKSYSVLILFPFLSRRPARRNRAALAITLCPDHHKQFTGTSQTDGNEALLAFGIRVFNSDRKRILKHAFGVGKRNPMFPEVCRRFSWIVPEPHPQMVYMLYVLCKLPVYWVMGNG
jgi:hypothetical protein